MMNCSAGYNSFSSEYFYTSRLAFYGTDYFEETSSKHYDECIYTSNLAIKTFIKECDIINELILTAHLCIKVAYK